jgi:hypothetical protein
LNCFNTETVVRLHQRGANDLEAVRVHLLRLDLDLNHQIDFALDLFLAVFDVHPVSFGKHGRCRGMVGQIGLITGRDAPIQRSHLFVDGDDLGLVGGSKLCDSS